MLTRRDLLLARRAGARVLELSGEQLYMRYVDSRLDGTTAALFETLAAELREIDELHVSQSAWLAGRDLSIRLDPVLAAFRARGGRVSLA
jgi:uncharacterized protein YecT (DUF1311 family)